AFLRERLEARAGIGDRDEVRALPPGALPEVVGMRTRLERAAGLRRRDEERPLEIDHALDGADRGGMRRVEHMEALHPERAPQHLGREARAAHAEEDDGVEALVRSALGKRLDLVPPL